MRREPRGRLQYVVAAVVTIAVGLLVHWRGAWLGPTVRDITGDALWAAMIVWWIGVLAPRARVAPRAAAAYGLCVAVESSQLLHTPWLDAVRATSLGHLILGSDFDGRDLGAYAVGVLVAMLIEWEIARRSTRRRETQRSF